MCEITPLTGLKRHEKKHFPMFFLYLAQNKRSKISVSRLEGIVWQMAHLDAESGGNKGQLSLLVEAIIRLFRVDDETEYEKLALKKH